MDGLLSMRVFVKVVDEGSFVSAARAFDVAPAAVTRLVADLEAHLGVRLLNRSTRRLALTAVGEQYLGRTRAILADIEEAEALASSSAAQPSGRVRALIPPSFSFHQLVKHLPRFCARYPDIAIDLTSAGALEMADEAYDVSVLLVRTRLEKGDFVARRLATTHVILCASPAYLSRHGVPTLPADLSTHRSLVVNSAVQQRIWSLQRADASEEGAHASEQTPVNILSAEHADSLFGAALAGLGIAALPSFVVEDALAKGSLVRGLDGWVLSTLTVYAAMPSRKYVPARTRAFMDFLVDTFSSPADPWLR
jgi:DNA-binding transcriptional LysR family regulator